MNAAWNWLGIFAWLAVLAYFFWMISNVHHRKKKMLKSATGHQQPNIFTRSNRNVEITTLEIILLLVAVFGLRRVHRQPLTHTNSTVVSQVLPLDIAHTRVNMKKPMAKPAYYYVDIKRTRAKDFKQTYYFMLNSKNVHASNRNAFIGVNSNSLMHNDNLPDRVHSDLIKHQAGFKKYRAVALRIDTVYRNTMMNGLGLLAGKKKAYYTVLKVPNRYWIYLNNHHLHRHSQRANNHK